MAQIFKAVFIKNFEMPRCCEECEFMCVPTGEVNITGGEETLLKDPTEPFCALSLENIEYTSEVDEKCWLAEVEVEVDEPDERYLQ